MTTYQVIFQGQILEGHNPVAVKKSVAEIFNKSMQQIEPLFSGKPIVIKKDIDEQTAKKYQATLSKAGAICEIKAVPNFLSTEKSAAAIAPIPAPQTTIVKATKKSSLGGRDVVNIAVPDSFTGLSLAAPGEILAPPRPARETKIADYSALSLAELGTLLSEPKELIFTSVQDFSGFTLENTDAFTRPTAE